MEKQRIKPKRKPAPALTEEEEQMRQVARYLLDYYKAMAKMKAARLEQKETGST